MQQWINDEIVPRAELTGEANTSGGADASQRVSFKVVRRGKFREGSFDQDAAGGAAAATTTHRYVRSSHSAADLQYGKTNRSLDRIIAGISNGETLAPLPLIANLRATKDKSDQREPIVADPIFQVRTNRRAMCISRDAARFHLLKPGRIETSMRGSGHSDFGKAEKCTDWNQHVKKQEYGESAAVPGVDPEPKMQSHTEVAPDEKDEKDLAEPRPGINPEVGDFVRVIDVDTSEDTRTPRVNDVDEEEIRN